MPTLGSLSLAAVRSLLVTIKLLPTFIVWQTQRIHAQVVHFLDDLETILDEADEDRRFDPQIITVRHRRSAEVGKRLRLSR